MADNKERCREQIFRGYHYFRCDKKAKKDGYCLIHHPDTVKKRRAKRDAAWNAATQCRAEQAHKQKDVEDKAARCEAAELRVVTLEARIVQLEELLRIRNNS